MYITFIVVSIVYTAQLFAVYHPKLTTWQDVASYDFSLVDQTYEDGTLTNTYGISTPEQLAGVFSIDEYTQQNIDKDNAVYADNITSIDSPNDVKQINNEYVLLNDVNMSRRSWTPTANFTGTFNGNYHVIQNLSITSSSYAYLGMVQRLSGTIKNLFLKNINVTNNRNASSQGGAGSVAGECYGDIKNVTVLSGSITGPQYYKNDDRKTGGLTGALTSGGQITNCVNYAFVGRSKFSGGIVGIQYSGTTIQFCYNYGSISNGTNDWPRAGGICGESYGTIKLCVNYGIVTSTTTPEGGGDVRAGGIVGYTTQSIDQCANFGRVRAGSSSTDKTYVGGIAGYSEAQIKNCYNMGNVSASAVKTESSETITRPNRTPTEKQVADNGTTWIKNTLNARDIEGLYINKSVTHCVIYGLGHKTTLNYPNQTESSSHTWLTQSGWAENGFYMNNQLNAPSLFMAIRGNYVLNSNVNYAYAGGIVGYSRASSIENCYNTGTISGGGVFYSLNTLVVYATKHTYKSSGNYKQTVKTDERSYSYTVGKYFVDGILGCSDSSSFSYSNCANDGSLGYALNRSTGFGGIKSHTFSLSDVSLGHTIKQNGNKWYILPYIGWNSSANKFYRQNGYTKNGYAVSWGFSMGEKLFSIDFNDNGNWSMPIEYVVGSASGNYEKLSIATYFIDWNTKENIDSIKDDFVLLDLDLTDWKNATSGYSENCDVYNAPAVSSFKVDSENWAKSSYINNGYPYLKNLYW